VQILGLQRSPSFITFRTSYCFCVHVMPHKINKGAGGEADPQEVEFKNLALAVDTNIQPNVAFVYRQ
jgi:hypothetical protein